MSVRQESATWAATLRRHIIPTGLGSCTVRVQQGTGGSPASGTAEVYLHGAAGSWTTFEPLLSDASPRDRVLIDLPGWGESTKGARLEHFGIEAMARAVTEVLALLGYPQWHLVGHSMGGFLALHIAAAWPERTASVAAISATTFGVSEAARKPLLSLSRFPAFVGMRLLMRSLAALGPAGLALVRAVGATPVLATRGDTDVFTSLSDLDRLAATIPNVRTVTIPRCGHFANVEQPEHVQQLLEGLWSL
ncbi:alpha/beta fold hydrolase [Pseudarthrobacter sp. MDT1-22]